MRPGYRRRFSRTERTLHWANAVFFFFLLAIGPDPLPAEPRDPRRAAAARPERCTSGRGSPGSACSLLIVVLGDRRGILRSGTRGRRLRRDDLRWLTRPPPRAAGALQRRPEAQHGAHRGVRRAVPRLGAAALVRGARHPASLREHRRAPRRADVRLARAARRALYLAVIHPTTRHALRGITLGTVNEEWADAPPPQVEARIGSRCQPFWSSTTSRSSAT